MNSKIEIEDVKLWLGELLLENLLLQKELLRLKAEMEEIKRGLFDNRPLSQGGKEKKKGENYE
jgi:hypothetical protein